MKQFLRIERSLRFSHYLFAGVFVLRLIVLARLTLSPFLLPLRGDMHFYDHWAQRILQGQWSDHLAFYGLPLYAYFLAFVYKLSGYGPFVPIFLQALVEAGTSLLLYRLGVRVFSSQASKPPRDSRIEGRRRGQVVGVLAAIGWAFFMPAQTYAVILMPTVWFVFAFWLVIWLIVRTKFAPGPMACLAFGLFIGFVAMGVATILFLIPLVVGALFLKPTPVPVVFRAKLVAVSLVFVGIGLGTSPCWIHNYFVARDPVILSAHSGVNLWIGNNPTATGYPRFPPGLHAGQEAMLKDSINVAERASGRPLKRSEVSKYWSSKANDYIRSHFQAWLFLIGVKINNFWNAFQYDDLSMITALREHGVIMPGLRFGLVAALGIAGLFTALWRWPASRWVATAIILHMISLLSVFVTERYRLAAVPGLLLFAAAGVVDFWLAISAKAYRRIGLYAGLLVLASWFVSIPKHDLSLWALDSYNSGWQALESNDLVTAEKKLNVAYAYVPGNAETNFALGNLQLAKGDKATARSYYLATLRLDSDHEGAYNNLGVLALEEKQWDLAAQFFARTLQQDPTEPKTYYLLAQAYFNARNLPGAERAISQAVKLRPEQPEFLSLQEAIREALREPR